jgi:hypothetical protein
MSQVYTPVMREPEYKEGPKAKEEFERTMVALFQALRPESKGTTKNAERSRNICFWNTQNREIGAIGLKGLKPGLVEGYWNRLRSYLALLLPATWRDPHQGQNCIQS